jgi:nicotinamide mononucleotide transporter
LEASTRATWLGGSGRHGRLLGYGALLLLSGLLAAGTLLRILPFDRLETLGFISGAWGVWLQVRENVWNWPVQLISSALYVVVFFQARLFADTSLNVLYVALYLLGWYWWLRGGENHGELHINRTSRLLALSLAVVGLAATAVLTVFLTSVRDAAPFLDALTTVASLIALFMIGRKLLESWWVWIAVNLVYIGLYVYKGLVLTAVLYAIFAVLSVVGLLNWRQLLAEAVRPPALDQPPQPAT